MSLLAASILGLGLGVKHAFEADHVAAVCTMVMRDGSVTNAVKSGALWGTGHGAVIIFAGGALVATGVSVPGPLALALDAAVALMLVGLGVAGVLAARRGDPARSGATPEHEHEHEHGHTHHKGRPLWVGLVHGASGTAALTLLVAKTIPGRFEALVFLILFGAASAIGMAVAAGLVAWPLRRATRTAPAIARALGGIAGVASIAAGLAVAWTALELGSTT